MIDIETIVGKAITKALKPVIKKSIEKEGYTFTALTNCGYEMREYSLQVGFIKEGKKYWGFIDIEPYGSYTNLSFTAYLETDNEEYVDVDLDLTF